MERHADQFLSEFSQKGGSKKAMDIIKGLFSEK